MAERFELVADNGIKLRFEGENPHSDAVHALGFAAVKKFHSRSRMVARSDGPDVNILEAQERKRKDALLKKLGSQAAVERFLKEVQRVRQS